MQTTQVRERVRRRQAACSRAHAASSHTRAALNVHAYERLLEIASLLLSAADPETMTSELFRRIVKMLGAARGFVVLKRGVEFEPITQLDFDRDESPEHERLFSRSVVRKAISSGQPVLCNDLSSERSFASAETIDRLGERAAAAFPLTDGTNVFGALYLERAVGAGPFDTADFLRVGDFVKLGGLTIARSFAHQSLRARASSLERDLFAKHDFRGIVTQSEPMLALLRLVAQVSPTSAPVLLRGETGTGKELLARAIHANSARCDGPYMIIHCAALPSSVLESELFGHTRGAFTGAHKDRGGRVAAASGGTLVLDEVGEIPLDIQAKLLRLVQFGEVTTVGSDQTTHHDVRLIAVTHRDLEGMVQRGEFRQDLYYRLRVLELGVPPLRERRSDIPLIVASVVAELEVREKRKRHFSREAMALLEDHDYPGNVRELRHAVERAFILSTQEEIAPEHLPPEIRQRPARHVAPAFCPPSSQPRLPSELPKVELPVSSSRQSVVQAAERDFLADLIQRSEGNIMRAARESGIHRSYLQRLLRRHGLR